MAQRKIIWTNQARLKLFRILEFYTERNKSQRYSEKLYRKINNELKLLLKYPNLGIQTDIEKTRGLIIGDFILFYENTPDTLIVHTLWDCRQNPDELKIK